MLSDIAVHCMNNGLGTTGYPLAELMWLKVCSGFLAVLVLSYLTSKATQGKPYRDGANAASGFGNTN